MFLLKVSTESRPAHPVSPCLSPRRAAVSYYNSSTVIPPKMAKRKGENRTFLDRWETDYLFMYVKDKPVCLVCGANVSIIKEYNIRRHYETKHQDKYKDLDMTQRSQEVEEMKKGLVIEFILKYLRILPRFCQVI